MTKGLYAFEIIYPTVNGIVKVSLLLMYWSVPFSPSTCSSFDSDHLQSYLHLCESEMVCPHLRFHGGRMDILHLRGRRFPMPPHRKILASHATWFLHQSPSCLHRYRCPQYSKRYPDPVYSRPVGLEPTCQPNPASFSHRRFSSWEFRHFRLHLPLQHPVHI